MSNTETPFGAVFEMQRVTIEQTGQLVESTLAVPRKTGDSLPVSGYSGRELRAKLLDSTRESVHQTVGLFESLQDDDRDFGELHATVDVLFDVANTQQDETSKTAEEEYVQMESVFRETMNETLETVVNTHEDIESQFVSLLENVEEGRPEHTNDGSDSSGSPVETEIDDTEEAESERASTETDSNSTADTSTEAAPEDGKVRCRLCNETFAAITHSHLQTHEMSVTEYRTEFGEDVPLRPDQDE